MSSRPRHLLLLLLLGHLLLSLAVNAVTPSSKGPTSPISYLFIRYLQLYHRLPVQGLARDAVRARHPPGYFLLGALLTAWLPAPASADFADLGLTRNPALRLPLRRPRADQQVGLPAPHRGRGLALPGRSAHAARRALLISWP